MAWSAPPRQEKEGALYLFPTRPDITREVSGAGPGVIFSIYPKWGATIILFQIPATPSYWRPGRGRLAIFPRSLGSAAAPPAARGMDGPDQRPNIK